MALPWVGLALRANLAACYVGTQSRPYPMQARRSHAPTFPLANDTLAHQSPRSVIRTQYSVLDPAFFPYLCTFA